MKDRGLIITLVLFLALALGLAACGSDTTPTTAVETTVSPGTDATATTASAPAATATGSVPQGIQDPVGDVRDLDGGVAEGPFAALGDIESVSLELQSDALVLLINTAEGAPTALPEGVDSLSFVLELKIDQDTDYIVAMSQAMGFPSWLVSVTDFASGATELVDAGATATGDTLRCAVPLASMPGFAPSFKWRVDATWATATAAWDDEVPERGADILNPALLDFPY